MIAKARIIIFYGVLFSTKVISFWIKKKTEPIVQCLRGNEKKNTQKQIYESIMDKLLLIWIITSSATIGSYAFNKKKWNE